jgi:hypothetical protein
MVDKRKQDADPHHRGSHAESNGGDGEQRTQE